MANPIPLVGGGKIIPTREDLERLPWQFFAQGKRGRGAGLDSFTAGGFLDEFNYAQMGFENLLKAADDLTDGTYWTTDGVTATEPSAGIFRLTKTAAADKYIAQVMTNWFPAWAGTVSIVVSVQSDDLTAMSVALLVDGADAVDSAEVISGNANVAVASSIANITSIRRFAAVGWRTKYEITSGAPCPRLARDRSGSSHGRHEICGRIRGSPVPRPP